MTGSYWRPPWKPEQTTRQKNRVDFRTISSDPIFARRLFERRGECPGSCFRPFPFPSGHLYGVLGVFKQKKKKRTPRNKSATVPWTARRPRSLIAASLSGSVGKSPRFEHLAGCARGLSRGRRKAFSFARLPFPPIAGGIQSAVTRIGHGGL